MMESITPSLKSRNRFSSFFQDFTSLIETLQHERLFV